MCPTFPSHLGTLQAAAREFFSTPVIYSEFTDSAETTWKPEWLNLFTLIFHCYFQYMQRPGLSKTPPDPLVDALLLYCDSDFEDISTAPGFEPMLRFLARCISEATPSHYSPEDVSCFLEKLQATWIVEKRFKLGVLESSLMPWSSVSIKEGSLSRE